MPYTTVVAGTTITASWSNANVRDQVVTPFATSAARASAITSPIEGMVSYLSDNNRLEFYDGAAWKMGALATRGPAALVTASGAQGIASSTDTAASFDTEVIDTDGMFTPTSTTVTIQTPGIYEINGGVDLGSNASGTFRSLYLRVAGVQVALVNQGPSSAFGFTTTISRIRSMAAADAITMTIQQNSGSTLNTAAGTWLSVVYLSPV